MKKFLLLLSALAFMAGAGNAQLLKKSNMLTNKTMKLNNGMKFSKQAINLDAHAPLAKMSMKTFAGDSVTTDNITRNPKHLSYEVTGDEYSPSNFKVMPAGGISYEKLAEFNYGIGYSQTFNSDFVKRFAGNTISSIAFYAWKGQYADAKIFIYEGIDNNGNLTNCLWEKDVDIKGYSANVYECDYVIPDTLSSLIIGYYANVSPAEDDQFKSDYGVCTFVAPDNTQYGYGAMVLLHSYDNEATGYIGDLNRDPYGNGCMFPIMVETTGDAGLRNNDVNEPIVDQLRAGVGTTQKIMARITNLGLDSISSIDYTYENDGKTTSGRAEMTDAYGDPASVAFGSSNTFYINAPVNSKEGRYGNGKLTITKVNGKADDFNEDNVNSKCSVVALDKGYLRTPVLEEFTSTTCGWCPFGIIGLEKALKAVDGKAVAISAHTDYSPSLGYDPLAVESYEAIVNSYAYSFPSIYVNREFYNHAYYNIEDAVKEIASKPCEAKMTVNSKRSVSGLRVGCDVTFSINAPAGSYAVGYVITEDNIEGVSQYNNFIYCEKGEAASNYIKVYNELSEEEKNIVGRCDYTGQQINDSITIYWSKFTMDHVADYIIDPAFVATYEAFQKLLVPETAKGMTWSNSQTITMPKRTADSKLTYTSSVPSVQSKNLNVAAFLLDLSSGKIITAAQAKVDQTGSSSDELISGINEANVSTADDADITVSNGAFNVKAENAIAKVYDAQGRLVSSASVNGEASLPTFGSGVYVINVTTAKGVTSQKAIF